MVTCMIACVQRVSRAKVSVGGEVQGEIGTGLVVLLGVAQADTQRHAQWLAKKLAGLRVFEDAEGKMNQAFLEVGGAMLVVSQFTLLGDCRKGRRPSFTAAASPEKARALYEFFIRTVRKLGIEVATGCFRQHMELELVNDGPVTLLVESGPWCE